MSRAEPWALELLRSARVGRLGTAGADGAPLVVPICYALLEGGGALEVVSAVDGKPKRSARLRRLRHLAENPRATLLVDVWDEDWARLRWVMVEGAARVLSPGDSSVATQRLAALEALEAKYPQYQTLPLDPAAPVILLAATAVRAWRWQDAREP